MKLTKIFNKKLVAILSIGLMVTGAAVGTTVAYLKDTTDTLTNTFEVGSVETELLEVVSGTNKQPYVYNAGKNDCYVRVRATVTPSTAGELQAVVKGFDTNNWKHEGDYYYYQKPLAPGAITDAPLFKEIIKENIEAGSFEIQLYQEAVQTSVNGEELPMKDIWAFYEAQNESNN